MPSQKLTKAQTGEFVPLQKLTKAQTEDFMPLQKLTKAQTGEFMPSQNWQRHKLENLCLRKKGEDCKTRLVASANFAAGESEENQVLLF